MRPFRFGLLIETTQTTRAELLALARRAEAEGYDTVLGTDHLGRLASLPLLLVAAEHTNLRIGTLVLNNDFRHPAILAQELATVDMLTGGRLDIGLGAGWNATEYVGAALSFDDPALRVTRLQASVQMMKQAFAEGRIDRAGDDAYPTVDLADMPRPAQQPHPPFLIGGGGPRVLRFAAREAQIVGLDPRALRQGGHDRSDVTAPLFDEKIGWIREAAGDRFDELDINIIVFGVDTGFGTRPAGTPSPHNRHPISDAEMAESPHYLVGSADQMADDIRARRERWSINYYAIRPTEMDHLSPVIATLAGS